ncbi:MAG: MFS transporter [Bacteroidaceae bacterium]|nr:MFS transporter [Bacteroidaceae bacterium]
MQINNMKKKGKAFAWVPTLYMGESLPYAAVMLMSVVLYQEMGLTDTQIALYTSWLGLPWVIKPLWSPFVDMLRTKRWWILSMQLLIGGALGAVALTLPTAFWLQASLALFMLVAFSSATHDISADGFYILGLNQQDQELYVGVRNTFYRIGMVLGQGGLVVLAGALQRGITGSSMSVPLSWSITFMAVAVLMLLLFAYHSRVLPQVEEAKPEEDDKPKTLLSHMQEFARTWVVFFSKPHIISALCFILLFRLPEGLLTKIVPLFLKRSRAEGGLGLDSFDYGTIYGTLGVIGLLGGGLLGGYLVSKYGLRRCLWPLVMCITLPDIVYVYLSYVLTENLWIIGSCVFVEQVGYGLGFTAYTLYLVSFARGERSTSVFSLCTAFQYLGGVMLPGMVSGWMSDHLGYVDFFWWVMGFCLVTFAVTAMVHLPKDEAS